MYTLDLESLGKPQLMNCIMPHSHNRGYSEAFYVREGAI